MSEHCPGCKGTHTAVEGYPHYTSQEIPCPGLPDFAPIAKRLADAIRMYDAEVEAGDRWNMQILYRVLQNTLADYDAMMKEAEGGS